MTFFFDYGHLDSDGARKVSLHFSKYLKEIEENKND